MSEQKFKTFANVPVRMNDMRRIPKPQIEIILPVEDKATPLTLATLPTAPTLSTQQPISPVKDFTKFPNSIVRNLDLFVGKSKLLYDYLYSITRGAITPRRSIRVTKSNLMRGAEIGSERTLLKNLAHLKNVGLVKTVEFEGQHGGNEYEVFLPEERSNTPLTPPTPHHPRHSRQKVGTVPTLESGVGGVGEVTVIVEEKDTLRLSLKDKKDNDDELTRKIAQKFAARFGRGLSGKEKSEMSELCDVIADELEKAFTNTSDISNAAKFATEHFRRKLAKPDFARKLEGRKVDTVGQDEFDRDGELQIWVELIEEGGQVADFEKYKDKYSREDWDWLTREIKKNVN